MVRIYIYLIIRAEKSIILHYQDYEFHTLEKGNKSDYGTLIWFFYLTTEMELEEEILLYDFSQVIKFHFKNNFPTFHIF